MKKGKMQVELLSTVSDAERLLALNRETAVRGLTLTKTDIDMLEQARLQALNASGRVEFGGGISPALVKAFWDSPYLDPANYARMLAGLMELFYHFKTEMEDAVPDAELLALMRDHFDGSCHGSLELLGQRELEQLAERIRFRGADTGTSNDPLREILGGIFDPEADRTMEGET